MTINQSSQISDEEAKEQKKRRKQVLSWIKKTRKHVNKICGPIKRFNDLADDLAKVIGEARSILVETEGSDIIPLHIRQALIDTANTFDDAKRQLDLGLEPVVDVCGKLGDVLDAAEAAIRPMSGESLLGDFVSSPTGIVTLATVAAAGVAAVAAAVLPGLLETGSTVAPAPAQPAPIVRSAPAFPIPAPAAQSTESPSAPTITLDSATTVPAVPSRPLPTPFVIFGADPEFLILGSNEDCSILSWRVDNAESVFFEGRRVDNADSVDVCQGVTATFTLEVVTLGGDVLAFNQTIDVLLDTTPPEIFIGGIRPSEPGPQDVVQLFTQVEDDMTGVANVELHVDGEWHSDCGQNNCVFNIGPLTGGEHQLELVAFDRVGNEASIDETVFVTELFADLVVEFIEQVSQERYIDETVEVPIEVLLSNFGDTGAGILKVSVSYDGSFGSGDAMFTVKGQTDPNYPFTERVLGSGHSVALTGVVIFPISRKTEGQFSVSLVAIADSCSGEPLTTRFCRVQEDDERNNSSKPLIVPVSVIN